MKVTVKFFASVREVIGVRAETIEVADGASVGDVWKLYVAKFPRLEKMGLGYAVNHEYSGPERVLKDGDDLALIPPVSGGCR
jgi:molybdopterin converting factor subunit 1